MIIENQKWKIKIEISEFPWMIIEEENQNSTRHAWARMKYLCTLPLAGSKKSKMKFLSPLPLAGSKKSKMKFLSPLPLAGSKDNKNEISKSFASERQNI